MKYIHVYALFLMFVFHTSCGQKQTNVPQDNITQGNYSESQIKEAATSKVFGLDLEVECIVMIERPSRTLKVKRVRNNMYC